MENQKSINEIIEDIQEVHLKSGGRFLRQAEIKEMKVGELLFSLIPNGVSVKFEQAEIKRKYKARRSIFFERDYFISEDENTVTYKETNLKFMFIQNEAGCDLCDIRISENRKCKLPCTKEERIDRKDGIYKIKI